MATSSLFAWYWLNRLENRRKNPVRYWKQCDAWLRRKCVAHTAIDKAEEENCQKNNCRHFRIKWRGLIQTKSINGIMLETGVIRRAIGPYNFQHNGARVQRRTAFTIIITTSTDNVSAAATPNAPGFRFLLFCFS